MQKSVNHAVKLAHSDSSILAQVYTQRLNEVDVEFAVAFLLFCESKVKAFRHVNYTVYALYCCSTTGRFLSHKCEHGSLTQNERPKVLDGCDTLQVVFVFDSNLLMRH